VGEARPSVSVVVVNYRRAEDTIECVQGLQRLDWSPELLEIIVVDNASGDQSVERIRGAAPTATVIASKENTGFAGGCNRGAAAAKGQYLAFINNDARPDPGWIAAAVAVLERDASVVCVASKVLDWEGDTLDFADAAASFYGHGFKTRVGDADDGEDAERDVLFAHGAAMVIDAEVFRDAGRFDDRYFMFFEDVDLGWRLWLLGYRVRYVPASIVFHRQHASMSEVGLWREHYLLERNALFTIYKNFNDHNLQKALPASLALAIRRGIALSDDDPHSLDLRRSASDDGAHQLAHKQTLAATFAVDAFVEELSALNAERTAIQARRRRPDNEILRLFRLPMHANIPDPYFLQGFDSAVEAFGIKEMFSERRRIVVATGDTLEPAMAGPAIRAWQIASALSREHDVQLVTDNRCDGVEHPDFPVRKVTPWELHQLVDWCDVLIFQGHIMHQHPSVGASDKVLVADIYDPFHLEQLEQARDLGPDGHRQVVLSSTWVLNRQLARGDFFMCASEKQRDFWLGQLAAVGRINPLTYDEDETLENLLAVVPFGVSDAPPVHTRPVLKGVVPGIGPDDKVLLWGGGIYNWFDPLTLLRAVDKLRARLPQVRLYFLGLKHPNPHVPEMKMAIDTRALADELGLTGTHVFFNEGWVEYADRQNYLLEADIGVSTHFDHVETQFSFRTRILDYFWASLPVVTTGGDALADLLEESGAGIAVPAEDVDALEAALYVLLTDEDRQLACRKASLTLADEYRWSRVLEPLVEFCRSPRRAPDLADPRMAALLSTGEPQMGPGPRRWREYVAVAMEHVQRGQYRALARKTYSKARVLAGLPLPPGE
jgi:GT2 family glycosyltransferase/glycosyltransferase involved in cell wall biosynthesis